MAAVLLSNLKRAKREYGEEDTSQNSMEVSIREGFDSVETSLQAAIASDHGNLEAWHTLLDDRADAMAASLTQEATRRGDDYTNYVSARDNQKSAVRNYGENIQAGEVAVGSLETGELVIDGGSLAIDGFSVQAVVVGGVAYIAVGM